MKANELRILNFVYNQFNTQIQIESISNFGVNLKVVDLPNEYLKETLLDEIKPIPLTEEWLFKFGYKKEGDNYQGKFHKIWKCNNLFVCEKNGIVLRTVHQLQNLYFALTGEEITFKTKL